MKLEIDGTFYQLPESWEQVTTQQYFEIQKIKDDLMIEEDDKECHIIKVLANVPDEVFQKCSMSQLRKVYEHLTFKETEIPTVDLKQPIALNGKEYIFDINIADNATYGMKVDLKRSENKEMDECMLKISAILLRPIKKKKYNFSKWKGWKKENYITENEIEDYNYTTVEERVKEFQDLPITITNTLFFFILIFPITLLNLTLHSMNKELEEMENQPL